MLWRAEDHPSFSLPSVRVGGRKRSLLSLSPCGLRLAAPACGLGLDEICVTGLCRGMKESTDSEKTNKETPAEPSIEPGRITFGQTAARSVVNRDDGKGGALPLAEQPGVVPDYPFQGKPKDGEPTVPRQDKQEEDRVEAKTKERKASPKPTYGV